MTEPHTLVHQLAHWATATPDAVAIAGTDGRSQREWTWAQYLADVRRIAKGLLALGVAPGECVALVGDNRPGWVLCEMGIMAVRGIPAPIYTTNTAAQVAFIIDHSQARVAICDKQVQLDKYLACLSEDSAVEHIVVMDDLSSDDPRVLTLAALMDRGDAQSDESLDDGLQALAVDETALLIYTSGTTGTPKAVQLDHQQMMGVASALVGQVPPLRTAGYRAVSYLPLCHVAEQLFTIFLHLDTGGHVTFCPDIKQLKDHLVAARPTVFLGVPRVWEKFQAALTANLAAAPPVKARLAAWAMATEQASFEREVASEASVSTLSRRLANKLVISKIKEKLGLDRIVVAATGAAPISRSTLDFFASLGLVVHEAYGMSETTGVATMTKYGRPRFGAVGQPLPSVQLRIADDGEILLKGPGMTRGYLRQPNKTAELLDEDGWLHTGDLGAIDPHGDLRITGRKKDILITAGGKNVAPAEMEAHIQPIVGVAQVVVVGDQQPYLAALITADGEALEQVNALLGTTATTVAELAADARFEKHVREGIESGCNTIVARYQTIKRFKLLPGEFTVDGGELTPTMKLKRNIITKKYAADIEALYAG
jgi:long-subunit acyl-CoA synthetase (AMP-forming)